MSATAFQRRRRELARQKQIQLQQKDSDKIEETKAVENDLEELTKDELKMILDEKGIEYNSRAKKDELIQLLKSE